MMEIEFDLEMFKKGSSNTTVQSYQPTAQEIRLQRQAADYSEAAAPNALKLNDIAAQLLYGSYGTVQADYDKMNQTAQNQIAGAQQGIGNLANGQLPEEYQKNMEASIKSGVQNSVGSIVSDLGSRGVLSSSVTNKAMQGINDSAAAAMADQYGNNIGLLSGLYGQQINSAGAPISTSAGAQEAAQNPALNLWNASLGLNSGGTLGALQAMGGQGTTTATSKQSGGSGLFGGILGGLAGNPGLFGSNCFVAETKIRTPEGEVEIRRIAPGDKVLEAGTDEPQEVVEVLKPRYAEVFTVVCGPKEYVSATLTQSLLTEAGEFVTLDRLRIGTRMKGKGTVKSVIHSGERRVYDLKLANGGNHYANGFIAKGATDEW